jgi:hypothetical protein
MTYYDKEFQKLGEIRALVKLMNDEGETKWFAISPEQIQAILAILNKNEVKE